MATPDHLGSKQLDAVTKFNVEAFTLLAIAILATGLRTYSRVRMVGFKQFQADDYLVLVGITFDIIETVLAYCVGVVGRGLANNSVSDEHRAALSPDSPEYGFRIIGSKLQVCGWMSYSILLWSLKGAVCTFYLRMTSGMYEYRKRIYTGFVLIGATWLGLTMNLFLSCRPFHHMWQINPNPGILCQPAISPALVWSYWTANVGTDLYLISIPLPMLFRSIMPLWRKISLCCLFGCGFFIVLAATVRVAIVVSNPAKATVLAPSWAVRETFVAVITTNVPMIFPLFKGWFRPIISSLGYTLSRSKKYATESRQLRAAVTVGGRGAARRGPRSPNPIPNMTFNESEERIIGDVGLGLGLGMQALSTGDDFVTPSFSGTRSKRSPEASGVDSRTGRSEDSGERAGSSGILREVSEVDVSKSSHWHGGIHKRVDIDIVVEEEAQSTLGQAHFAAAWATGSNEEDKGRDSRFSVHCNDGGMYDGSYRRLAS